MGSGMSKVAASDKSMAEHQQLQLSSLTTQVKDQEAELARLTAELEGKNAQTKKLYDDLQAVMENKAAAAQALVDKLEKLETSLASFSATDLPTWVASVDGLTSRVFFINTETKETTWERPDSFDGTFVVIDDVSGLTAKTKVHSDVIGKATDSDAKRQSIST